MSKYFKQFCSYCNYKITILKHFCWPLFSSFFVGSLQQIFWDKVRKDQCWNMQIFRRKIENKNLASCFLFYTWTSCRQVSINIICFSMTKYIDLYKSLDCRCYSCPLGHSWLWSYGSWIYNYLCNQCISLLKLWFQVLLMAKCIRINFMWYKVCQWLAASRWLSPGTPVSSTNTTDRHDNTEICWKWC